MKEKIKKWYKMGLWTAAMVQNAVNKGQTDRGRGC